MFLPTDPANLQERMVALPTGVSLHVVERTGSAPPVVLLHGVWGWWRHWIPLLASEDDPLEGRRLVLPEFRGHGESDRSDTGYTLDAAATDIVALIEQEGIGRLILGGHSLGALIALMIAGKLADRIEAMILEEPPLPLPTGELAEATAERWLGFAEDAAGLAELRQQPADTIAATLMERDPELTQAEAEMGALCLSLVDERVFAAVLTEAVAESSRLVLPHLAMPVLVFQGGDAAKRMLQDAGVAQLREVAPQLTVATIPDAGHSVLGAVPDAYGAALRRFLA